MTRCPVVATLLLLGIVLPTAAQLVPPDGPPVRVRLLTTAARPPHRLEEAAAREVRRYVYAGTQELAPVTVEPCSRAALLGAEHGDLLLLGAGCSETVPLPLRDVAALAGEEHAARLLPSGAVLLAGGSPTALLYSAYRYAEAALGVHFTIGGDAIPRRSRADHAVARGRLPTEGVESPEFAVRGLNPFHDFAMGPDFWEEENYKAYTTQMAKLRMNFIVRRSFHVASRICCVDR